MALRPQIGGRVPDVRYAMPLHHALLHASVLLGAALLGVSAITALMALVAWLWAANWTLCLMVVGGVVLTAVGSLGLLIVRSVPDPRELTDEQLQEIAE